MRDGRETFKASPLKKTFTKDATNMTQLNTIQETGKAKGNRSEFVTLFAALLDSFLVMVVLELIKVRAISTKSQERKLR